MNPGTASDPAQLAAIEVSRLLASADGLLRLVELARREDAALMSALPAEFALLSQPEGRRPGCLRSQLRT
jgi:hypothetical protein